MTITTQSHPASLESLEGHARLFSAYVRTAVVAYMTASVTDAAERLSKRIPGVVAHIFTTDHGYGEFCAVHGVFGCGGDQFTACHKVPERATEITVTATGLPVFDGTWRVGGMLRVDVEGVVTAHTVGASEDGFATAHVDLAGSCEHCHTNRRRSLTVLLVDDEGTVRPVGRSCLAEYTGAVITAELVTYLSRFRSELDESEFEARTAAADSAPVEDIVAVARILIDMHGFVRSDSGGFGIISTRVRVEDCIAPRGNGRPEVVPAELTDQERQAARDDIALVAGGGDGSEYAFNLAAVVANEWAQITGRGNKLGLLASLPVAADRARREARPVVESGPSAWIGAVGDKITVTGTVAMMRAIEGDYGTRWLIKVDTADGAVKMFTTARGMLELDEGDAVTIAATVKAHETYQGVRETMVLRPKRV